ncbi:MAG: FkbM family methyltransferase [Chthoniobacteraceae bacterium]
MPPVPFNIILPTAYGQMLVNRHDINQTNALFKTGHAIDHGEIVLLARVLQLLGADLTVLDVGANFGTYTLALARCVGTRGRVHAFEPQRIIFQMLAGSVALNSLTNVFCHHLALGDREGRLEIPQFDYAQPLNFGSIEFTATQHEPLTQPRGHDPQSVEYVPLTTIDRFEFPQVHLMKIDAEGMEMQVLEGAMNTLRRCRPVLYLEFLKNDKVALQQWVAALDYAVYENGINFLCIPAELKDRIQVNQTSADATRFDSGKASRLSRFPPAL